MSAAAPRIDEVAIETLTLSLRETFRTHWKTLTRHPTLLLRLRSGETWGEGEAYTMDVPSAARALREADLAGRPALELAGRLGGIEDHAARSALDLALLDLEGRLTGQSAHDLLGLPAGKATSCVSVGIDAPERMLASAERWIRAGYPILKVKITTDTDLSLIEEIRRLGGPALRLWVDANQAFDPRTAIEAAAVLARANVEVFEQPLPVGSLPAYAEIRPRIEIPIVLDEEIQGAEDVAAAARLGGVDGVNVKLAKMGGLRAGLRAIEEARAHGMRIFLGCYFESSLGIGAAAQLLSCAEWVDLDAPLFLESDPFEGLAWDGAVVRTPAGAGLGVSRR